MLVNKKTERFKIMKFLALIYFFIIFYYEKLNFFFIDYLTGSTGDESSGDYSNSESLSSVTEPSFIDQVSDFFNGAFTDLSKFFSEQDEDYPAVAEMSEEDFHEFSKY